MGRIRDEVSERQLMFSYKEFGEMKNPVWKARRELLSNFLVGTPYMDKDVMKIMNLQRIRKSWIFESGSYRSPVSRICKAEDKSYGEE